MRTIGLDLGTTSLSAVVIDHQTGRMLKALNVPNTAQIADAQKWMSLQDPACIAQTAAAMVESLKKEFGPVCAIGIDGQMHGMLYLDAQGVPLSPLFTWQDSRGDQPYQEGTYASRLSALTGYSMNTGFGLTTHFWHVVNNQVPKEAAVLCTIFDYVGMCLTGRTRPLMHTSGAASFGLWDHAQNRWDAQALSRAGIDASILPETTDGFALLGVDKDGIPVSCAIGDNQASFIGSIRNMEDSVLVNMGTGGQVSMMTSVQALTKDLERRPLADGSSILVGSSLCGGRSYALLEGFVRSCASLCGCASHSAYDQLNSIAMESLERSDLMHVDTRFSGTRHQPEVRASISGINVNNFHIQALLGGTLMGMAAELKDMYDHMIASGAKPASLLVGSGNAIRRSPALKRAFEKTFGLPMQIPAHQEEAAFGAALFGMTAAGIVPSLALAQALLRYEDEQ